MKEICILKDCAKLEPVYIAVSVDGCTANDFVDTFYKGMWSRMNRLSMINQFQMLKPEEVETEEVDKIKREIEASEKEPVKFVNYVFPFERVFVLYRKKPVSKTPIAIIMSQTEHVWGYGDFVLTFDGKFDMCRIDSVINNTIVDDSGNSPIESSVRKFFKGTHGLYEQFPF